MNNVSQRRQIKFVTVLAIFLIVCGYQYLMQSEEKVVPRSIEPAHSPPLNHILPGRTRSLLDSDDSNNCTFPEKHRWFGDSCSFVRATCAEEAGLFDYLQFVFCDLDNVKPLAYVIMGFWVLLLISLLATTADYFFVPPLYLLAEKLKLSPSIAGITLLAIGNGAPDVFTAYSALQSSDLALLLGALIGASIFISTVVLGSVILMTKVTKDTISPIDFTRDVVTYLLVVGTVIAVAFDGSVQLYEAIMFLVIYFFYICVVVVISFIRQYYTKKKMNTRSTQRRKRDNSPLLASKIEGSVVEVKSTTLTESATDPTDLEIKVVKENDTGNALPALSYPKGEHIGVKIQWFVEWPFSLLRWITVPPCYHDGKWDSWRHFFVISSPMPMAMLMLLTVKGTDGFSLMVGALPLYQMLLIFGLALSILAYFVVPSRHPPHWSLQIVLGTLAFVMSIAWLNLEANEVIAVLEAYGILFDIDTAILGLTVLAIGNSVGDWVADTAVARAGHPAMGVSSCFGSPLLNDVLGLGIALTTKIVVDQGGKAYTFDISDPRYIKVKLSWIFLGISLLASVVVFPLFKFSPPKTFGVVLIYIYFVFMVFSILNEVGVMKITL